MNRILPTSQGFGEYRLPDGRSFESMQIIDRIKAVAEGALYVVAAVFSIALMTISPLAGVVGAVLLLGSAALVAKQIIALFGISRRSPPTNDTFSAEIEATVTPLDKPCEEKYIGFPTEDSIDSHRWKLELIRAANHSIILSGCYCGGETFDETLEIIAEQMRAKPQLKTSILATDLLITGENRAKIAQLSAEFGPRFQMVVHPENMPYVGPATKDVHVSANHTKVLVIDGGAYYMLGGSGIVRTWASNHGMAPPEQPKENFGIAYSIVGPTSYRDMDFVFHSPTLRGIGTRIHMEMSKLLRHLSETPITVDPIPEAVDTVCPAFDARSGKIDELETTCYATGPDALGNSFLDALISSINEATESITIDHMYFHPSDELLNALIAAANRGVHITIITNRTESDSPRTHKLYGELSRKESRRLYRAAPPGTVDIYEYGIPHTTLHKKVVVIDGKRSLFGSANIGYKSLERHSDYELNLRIDSLAFAQATLDILEKEKAVSAHLTPEEASTIPLRMYAAAAFQYLLKPLL